MKYNQIVTVKGTNIGNGLFDYTLHELTADGNTIRHYKCEAPELFGKVAVIRDSVIGVKLDMSQFDVKTNNSYGDCIGSNTGYGLNLMHPMYFDLSIIYENNCRKA